MARWYADAGYRVLDRNWRCREGELDVVVARGSVLVFCEVKTRRSTAFGVPAEAVTVTKQRRLRTLAMRWLDAHPDSAGPHAALRRRVGARGRVARAGAST